VWFIIKCLHLIYNTRANYWTKDTRQIVMLVQRIPWMHILNGFYPTSLLVEFIFLNLFIIIFGLGFFFSFVGTSGQAPLYRGKRHKTKGHWNITPKTSLGFSASLGTCCDSYLLVSLVVIHPKVQFLWFLIYKVFGCNKPLWLAHHQKHFEICRPPPRTPTPPPKKWHIVTLFHRIM